MRIIEFNPEPLINLPFLNAGRGAGAFYKDRLPIYEAHVDGLGDGIEAIVVTADLQGRELFSKSRQGPPRLLGEVLPNLLATQLLAQWGLSDPQSIGVLLAGDFYTVPNLDKRGGTGDVTEVWKSFAEHFAWVVGVAGNHDSFGTDHDSVPRFSSHLHYLDGDSVEVAGISIAGLGGIIGNPQRFRRRSEGDYLGTLELLLEPKPDILLLHDGPDASDGSYAGSSRIREVIEQHAPVFVVRGHTSWSKPLVGLANRSQVLNAHAAVILLREQS